MNRYHRQEILIGKEKQKLLQNSKVAIIGVGAIGTLTAELLARAGANLLLIDRDIIDLTNLQRQVLFSEEDLNKNKADVAREKLSKINSTIEIKAANIHLNSQNISILKKCNLILDCTDNLKTRYLINDFCKKNKLPWIYAAAIKKQGMIIPFFPEGPCLNCLGTKITRETCNVFGVLNTITSLVATLQTSLAMKFLTKEDIQTKLFQISLDKLSINKININKKEDCPTCNKKYLYLKQKPTLKLKFCGQNKYQILGNMKKDPKHPKIKIFADGRALIIANSLEEAESLYSKFVGN